MDRFWNKVQVGSPDACWPWLASRSPYGYGNFWRGSMTGAHRVAYELTIGPIPDGMTIDHLCRNRACQNPTHLEAVTFKENVRRGVGPTAVNGRKSHCVHGHELAGANLYLHAGRRQCRKCNAAAVAAYKERKKAAA